MQVQNGHMLSCDDVRNGLKANCAVKNESNLTAVMSKLSALIDEANAGLSIQERIPDAKRDAIAAVRALR